MILSLSLSTFAADAAEKPSASQSFLRMDRTAFPRGEVMELRFRAAPGENVTFRLGDVLEETVTAGEDGVAQWRLDTMPLREGDYRLHAQAKEGADLFEFTVGPRVVTGGIPLYRWGHVNHPMNLDWYRKRGFTGGTTLVMRDAEEHGSKRWKERMKLLDAAVREGFAIGFYLHPLWSEKVVQQDAARVKLVNGKRVSASTPWPVDPLTEPAQTHAREVTASFLEQYAGHPAVRYVMLSSEQRPLPGVNPELLAMAQKELGFDFSVILDPNAARFRLPDGAKRGVIASDDPDYIGRRWFFERGHGTALLNEEIAKVIRERQPRLKLSHEPWRNAPTRDVAKGLDLVGSWTYAYNDLKRLMFASFLRAPGRAEGQGVQAIVTLYVYGSMVMQLESSTADLQLDTSNGDPFFTASPDYVREAFWIYLSQRPEEMSVYWASVLSPEDGRHDEYYSSPESFGVIADFSEKVLKPYGPAILAGRPAKAKVALLASAAAAWFTDRPLSYNLNEAALPYASLLVQNHVPFEVLLDNDLEEGRLKDYEALVIPLGDTMTVAMREAIKTFIAQGGKVIADAGTVALSDEEAVSFTRFDFEPLLRQNGKAALEGREMVTAHEAREMMERYAKELAPMVKPYRGEVTSGSPRVIINSLDVGEGAWHFVINDDRTYGPKFGRHQLHFENGVRQLAPLRFRTDRFPVLYDLASGERVKGSTNVEQTLETELWLAPASGRMILALPEPVRELRLFSRPTAKAGEWQELRLEVVGESGKRMKHVHPVRISIRDAIGRETGWSGATALQEGAGVVKWMPALNDRAGRWVISARDLVTGKVTETTCVVTP